MPFEASTYGIRTDVEELNGKEFVVIEFWGHRFPLPLDFAKALHHLLGLAIDKAGYEAKKRILGNGG